MRLNVDSAPEVRRRYFNRVTEAVQFIAKTRRAPRPVHGLGDDDALGPAGAYWTGDFRQLFVLRGERLFICQLSAPGLGADDARRAAVRLARATLPGEARTGTERTTGGARSLDVEVLAPRNGEAVRSDRVVVRHRHGRNRRRPGCRPAPTGSRRRLARTVRLRPGANASA